MKQRYAWALICTIIPAVALGAAEKPMAVVNGEGVSRADFDAAWKRLPPPPTPPTETQKKAMQTELLSMMIDEMLLKQYLKTAVAMPADTAIQQCVAQVEAGMKAKGKTMADFYKETGVNETRFKSDIAASLQWKAFVDKYITQEDLKKYYDVNKEVFEGVAIRASHILVKVPAGADAKTEKEAMQRAAAIRAEIVKGVAFADAAKKYSDDPNKERGGELGWFPPAGSDPDPFFRAATALKAGEMSEPVRTEYGYHIIKVLERKAGKPTKYEEMKDAVFAVYADEMKIRILDEMRKKAKVEQVSLP